MQKLYQSLILVLISFLLFLLPAYLEHLLRVHFDNKKDLFEKIEPPFISGQDLYIMFSRKSNDGKKIRDDLNEEIEQMKKDGTYQQILNQHHLD